MEKQLCKSHITQLNKIAAQLTMRQKMNYTQLILSPKNQDKVDEAKQKIYEAVSILKEVK